MLSELAEGPVEKIFNGLISELPPIKAAAHSIQDELEANDDEEEEGDDADFQLINRTFKDLAISLKRTSNLDAMIEKEKKATLSHAAAAAAASESKQNSDDDASENGESKYNEDDDDDYDDDDIDDIEDDYNEDDYDEEFEAEPELASPVKPSKR
jgi:hypothetical protein